MVCLLLSVAGTIQNAAAQESPAADTAADDPSAEADETDPAQADQQD